MPTKESDSLENEHTANNPWPNEKKTERHPQHHQHLNKSNFIRRSTKGPISSTQSEEVMRHITKVESTIYLGK